MAETTAPTPEPKVTKRDRIVALLTRESGTPELSRKEIAEKAGCTVQRVGEVVRELGLVTVKPKQTHDAAKRGMASRAAKATLTVVPDLPADEEPFTGLAPTAQEALDGYLTESGVVGTERDAKAVYKYVMEMLAEGKPVSDEDFTIAVTHARVGKMKRPVR